MNSTDALQRAIELLGGPVKTARAIGVKNYQVVQQWRSRVPAEHCPTIERATNGLVRCEELRPDVDWAVLRGACDTTSVAVPGQPEEARDAA